MALNKWAIKVAPLVTAFLSGLLQTTTDRRVTVVNADAIAHELGVRVDVRGEAQSGAYASALRIAGDRTTITGISVNGKPRITDIDGYEIDAIPVGTLLMTRHADVPGMIGKVGTILGTASVNISTMQVSRNMIGGDAIMVLSVDRPADTATLDALRAIPGVASVKTLTL